MFGSFRFFAYLCINKQVQQLKSIEYDYIQDFVKLH